MDCHPSTNRPFVDEFVDACAHAARVVCEYGVKDGYTANILYHHVCKAMGWPHSQASPWSFTVPSGWRHALNEAYRMVRDGRKVQGQKMPNEADFRAMVIAKMLKGTFG